MSRVNLSMFEADLSASLLNLQRILDFLSLRNLASKELFFTSFFKKNQKLLSKLIFYKLIIQSFSFFFNQNQSLKFKLFCEIFYHLIKKRIL